MRPNDTVNIMFDTTLNLSLPIDVTNLKPMIRYSADSSIADSVVSYRWFGNDNLYGIPLPECPIIMSTGEQ